MLPLGADCTAADQCASGFCADEVCCTSACDLPDQRCDAPGREGQCVSDQPAPAPAASATGLCIAVVTLIAMAGLAFRRLSPIRIHPRGH
jgi:hypothetical protein